MTKQNFTAKKRGVQTKLKIGDTFETNNGGDCTLIAYVNKDNLTIQFNDSNKHEVQTTTNALYKGAIRNPYVPSVCGVGFVGSGRHIAHANGRVTVEYQVWHDMINRCYNPRVKERLPTYNGCTVHPDWHNFQVFAEWYTSHKYYGIGYHIDKDLLITGNKFYSAETCTLVPVEISVLFNEMLAVKGDYPTGVHYCNKKGRYAAGIRINGKRKQLGYYDCPNEASEVYVVAKKKYIKTKALEWRDRIEERLFQALMLRTI